MTAIDWTANMLGCQAQLASGMLFISPARKKSRAGATQFELTFRRSYGNTYQHFGTFESPPLAKLMADALVRDGRI